MSELKEKCKKREFECKLMEKAYELRLEDLGRINWLFVGGGTAFPIIGGASLLTSSNNEFFLKLGGILSIIGACLTAIHKAFNCESHQAECARIINELNILARAYETLRLDPNLSLETFKIVEKRREEFFKNNKARPGRKYIDKAKKYFNNNRVE